MFALPLVGMLMFAIGASIFASYKIRNQEKHILYLLTDSIAWIGSLLCVISLFLFKFTVPAKTILCLIPAVAFSLTIIINVKKVKDAFLVGKATFSTILFVALIFWTLAGLAITRWIHLVR